jgi:hypothetical protein
MRTLRQGNRLGDLLDAAAVGVDLAGLTNYNGMSKEDILEALEFVRVEEEREYPSILRAALIRAGLDPDVEAMRQAVVNSIRLFYNPEPWLKIVSHSATQH